MSLLPGRAWPAARCHQRGLEGAILSQSSKRLCRTKGPWRLFLLRSGLRGWVIPPPSVPYGPSGANSPPLSPSQSLTNEGSRGISFIEIIGLLLLGAILIYYFYSVIKASYKCRKCGADWSLKQLSSFDEPRATFQERRRTGEISSGGIHEGYINSVDTFETGLRTAEWQCVKCGHQETQKVSYKKHISSHSETV